MPIPPSGKAISLSATPLHERARRAVSGAAVIVTSGSPQEVCLKRSNRMKLKPTGFQTCMNTIDQIAHALEITHGTFVERAGRGNS